MKRDFSAEPLLSLIISARLVKLGRVYGILPIPVHLPYNGRNASMLFTIAILFVMAMSWAFIAMKFLGNTMSFRLDRETLKVKAFGFLTVLSLRVTTSRRQKCKR